MQLLLLLLLLGLPCQWRGHHTERKHSCRCKTVEGPDIVIIYTYKRIVCVCWFVGLLVCLLFIGHTTFVHFAALPPSTPREAKPSRAAPRARRASACTVARQVTARQLTARQLTADMSQRDSPQRDNSQRDNSQRRQLTVSSTHSALYSLACMSHKYDSCQPTCFMFWSAF